MPNGAQALLQTLADAGIEVCFSNPGTSEMHFVAALDSEPRMRAVLALFEGVATGAEEFDPQRIGDLAYGAHRISDVIYRGSDRVAHTAGDLNRIGEQLAGHGESLVGGLLFDSAENLGGARSEVACLAVSEHHLPLQTHG